MFCPLFRCLAFTHGFPFRTPFKYVHEVAVLFIILCMLCLTNAGLVQCLFPLLPSSLQVLLYLGKFWYACFAPGGGGGEESHMEQTGLLVVSHGDKYWILVSLLPAEVLLLSIGNCFGSSVKRSAFRRGAFRHLLFSERERDCTHSMLYYVYSNPLKFFFRCWVNNLLS